MPGPEFPPLFNAAYLGFVFLWFAASFVYVGYAIINHFRRAKT